MLLGPLSRRCRVLLLDLDVDDEPSCMKLNMAGSVGCCEPTTPSSPYTSFTCAYSAKSSESSGSGAASGACLYNVDDEVDLDGCFLGFCLLVLSPSCMFVSLFTFMRASASLTMAKFFRFNLPGCWVRAAREWGTTVNNLNRNRCKCAAHNERSLP